MHDLLKSAIEIEVAHAIQELDSSQTPPTPEHHMTADDAAHVSGLMYDFVTQAVRKYVAGKAEHGGDLRKMSKTELKRNLIQELIDGFIYAKGL